MIYVLAGLVVVGIIYAVWDYLPSAQQIAINLDENARRPRQYGYRPVWRNVSHYDVRQQRMVTNGEYVMEYGQL